ncbi:hypothetical protein J6W78_01485 [bacterium]|nr:hypothetical protein [bacterium]
MKNRFLLIISIALFVFSCNQFVNLGDKSADSEDNTEGLPDEIYESDNTDSASAGNYDDWNEDTADSDYYDEGGQDNYEENDEQYAPYPDEDYSDDHNAPYPEDDDPDAADTDEPDMNDPDAPNDDPYENAPGYIFPESDPFPEGFSNIECGCGNTPDYFPVCCDGMISVFNACFANCYAVKSGNKICSSYKIGFCGEAGIIRGLDEDEDSGEDADPTDDEDNETDDDTELPDEDADPAEIPNECGCYPENEPSIFSCADNSFYFITECLARCHCENPHKLSF